MEKTSAGGGSQAVRFVKAGERGAHSFVLYPSVRIYRRFNVIAASSCLASECVVVTPGRLLDLSI